MAHAPSKPTAIIGGLVAPLFGVASLAVLAAVVPAGEGSPLGGLARLFENAGAVSYLVLFAGAAGGLACAVLVVLSGLGRRIPSWAIAAVVAVPGLLGAMGMLLGVHVTVEAIAPVNMADRLTLAAAGMSEASGSLLLGTWFTAALAAGCAIGLGLAALGTSGNRRPVGALLALVALPLVGFSMLAVAAGVRGMAAVLALSALSAMIGTGFAGAARGQPGDARPGGLAAGAAALGALSFVATALALDSASAAHALEGLARADPAGRAVVLAHGMVGAQAAHRIALGGAAVGLVLVIVLAALAARPSAGGISGLATCVLVVLCAVEPICGRWSLGHAAAELAMPAHLPWNGIAGFQPVHARAAASSGAEVAVVDAKQIHLPGGQVHPVAWLSEPAAGQALGALVQGEGAAAAALRGHRDGPSLDVALDARTPAPVIRALLTAATEGHIQQLALVIQPPASPMRSRLPSIPELTPFLDALWNQPRALRVSLDMDPSRATTYVATGALTTAAPSSGKSAPQPFDEIIPSPEDPLILVADGDLDAQALVSRAAALASQEWQVGLAAAKPQPAPAAASAQPAAGGLGLIGSGLFGSATPAADDQLAGALGHSQIQQVVQRHSIQVRYCYEQALRANSALRGKLVVKFTILPDGGVGSAGLASDALHDPKLAQCVLARVKAWRFPRPKDRRAIEVSYPFVLVPQ